MQEEPHDNKQCGRPNYSALGPGAWNLFDGAE